MPGLRGTTWQLATRWLLAVMLALLPATGFAGDVIGGWHLPVLAVSAQSPLESQLVGEKAPSGSPLSPPSSLLQDLSNCPTFQSDSQGADLRLPQNFRVSFLYHREASVGNALGAADRPIQSPLLFRYSMDYCLLPNLQVGLSGFLYQPPGDILSLQRRYSHLTMGWGPGVKYDLGRWSFTFRSQLEGVRPEGGQDLQNWFRVWYAF